ncbi:MAG: hypothetical protein OXR66_06355 [Candidatus Woesearchaeota archaeon]|nr:hypothetical protein [Candidatus Woesearchaeota archaeon]
MGFTDEQLREDLSVKNLQLEAQKSESQDQLATYICDRIASRYSTEDFQGVLDWANRAAHDLWPFQDTNKFNDFIVMYNTYIERELAKHNLTTELPEFEKAPKPGIFERLFSKQPKRTHNFLEMNLLNDGKKRRKVERRHQEAMRKIKEDDIRNAGPFEPRMEMNLTTMQEQPGRFKRFFFKQPSSQETQEEPQDYISYEQKAIVALLQQLKQESANEFELQEKLEENIGRVGPQVATQIFESQNLLAEAKQLEEQLQGHPKMDAYLQQYAEAAYKEEEEAAKTLHEEEARVAQEKEEIGAHNLVDHYADVGRQEVEKSRLRQITRGAKKLTRQELRAKANKYEEEEKFLAHMQKVAPTVDEEAAKELYTQRKSIKKFAKAHAAMLEGMEQNPVSKKHLVNIQRTQAASGYVEEEAMPQKEPGRLRRVASGVAGHAGRLGGAAARRMAGKLRMPRTHMWRRVAYSVGAATLAALLGVGLNSYRLVVG